MTDLETLSPEEQAFFDSRGEKEIPAEVSQETPAAVQEQAPTEEITGQLRDEKGKFVPHQALHAEREEHKKTKSALEEHNRKLAILEDRWNTLLQLNKQEEPAVAAAPDPETDIFGFVKWQKDQLEGLQKTIADRDKANEEQQRASTEENQIWNAWQSAATSYAAENKDFDGAAKWLSDYRLKQLEALATIDPNMSNPAARNQQINAELRSIIVAAKQQNANPAELVFKLAQGYGYQPSGSEQQQDEKIDPNAALGEKIDQLGKAISASKTMTASAGKAAAEPNSAEALVNMTDAEFASWMKDPANKTRWKQLMGG